MHREQINFCKSVKEQHPTFFVEKNVLDCGSLDINGNNQYLFKRCTYVGIDVGVGRNVDVVSPTHKYNPDKKFDVVISTECFEHDMFYQESLKHIVNFLLKPGGLFLFTCASTNRHEHGTINNTPHNAPLLTNEWANYYKNLTENDVRNVINVDNSFNSYAFSINEHITDLYFWGIKK